MARKKASAGSDQAPSESSWAPAESWEEPDGSAVAPGDHPHIAIWDHEARRWHELPRATGSKILAALAAEASS